MTKTNKKTFQYDVYRPLVGRNPPPPQPQGADTLIKTLPCPKLRLRDIKGFGNVKKFIAIKRMDLSLRFEIYSHEINHIINSRSYLSNLPKKSKFDHF